jgi:hypothetical protein
MRAEGAVPYNRKLAERVRALLADEPALSERNMFGGVSFLLAGNYCCGVLNDDLVVRLSPEESSSALERAHVRPMDFTGRPMRNWLYIAPEGTKTKRALSVWVDLGRAFALSLPPK